ncbi:MAG TPA: hypothetical protein VLF40_01025 [Candidatus Saccharimonadales bacterium]|nr:hypothetical protein [Candidatus Saccharimonadales bacterium]
MLAAGETGRSPEAVLAGEIEQRQAIRGMVVDMMTHGRPLPDDMSDDLLELVDEEMARWENNNGWVAEEQTRLAPIREATGRIAAVLASGAGPEPNFTYRRPDGSVGVGWNLREPVDNPAREDELFPSSVPMVRTSGLGLTSHDGVRIYGSGNHPRGSLLLNVSIQEPDLLYPQRVREPNPANEDAIIGGLALLAFNTGVPLEGL